MKKIFRKIVLICLILINFIANAQQVPSYVPSSGLVGWWPFTGNAIDSSGNGNNGTVNGATLTTDRFGVSNKAYFFDGFNDNISLSRINVSQAVTLSVWVKNKKTSGYWRGIVTTQNNNTQGFLLQDASGSLKYDWTVSNGNGYYDLYNSTLIDTSKWVHIVGVITSDSMLIYYNGNLESQRGIGSRNLASTANLWFGSRYSSEYFNGKLDDIGLWNRQLSNSEIFDLYKSNTCTTKYSIDTITSCGPYTWTNGVTYTISNNTATDTFVNAAGCDSIVSLNLTVLPPSTIYIGSSNISSDTVICPNQNITLRYDTSNQTSSGSAASISGYAFLGSYGANNYYVSNSASNWSTANQSAISNGGHLADISSSGENSFLASKISTYSWIGYNDVASEGSFVWSSGSQSTYTNWRSNEPSNSGGNEDHTILWPNQEWSDWNGSTYHILEVSTISVLWSTGETSIEINVSPDTSTVYWVSSGGCRDSVTVTVQDVIKPTVVTQNLTVSLDATGSGSITATQVDNGSTDNCTIATRTLSKSSFDCSNVGTNTVYLIVTDANGNIDSTSAVVTVQDIIKPTVVTQNLTVSLDATGSGSITATQVDNGSTDNCSIATRTLSKSSFDCSEVGANTIWLRVTDANGNIDSASAVVTVQDIIKPTVLTQNVTVSLDASGAGSVTIADIDNGSTDNCAIATRSLSKSSFDCSNVGANTVWLRVTDVNGNIDSARAVVTVQDITKPTVVTTPSDIALGYCDATYTYAIPTSDDNCGVTVTQIAGLPPGSTFPVGLTVNTFEISDPSGNTVTTSFTVDIRARYMPFTNLDISLCNNNSKIDMTKGFDNIIFIGSGVEANEKFFNPNSLEPGSYSITAEFADSMGCVSTEQFIIEVRSTPVVPRIERVASDQIITAQAYGNYQWYRNGEELEGEDKQLLRVHELGIYSVLVGNDENCFEASEGYGFGIPVNEENVTNKGLVRVFPNPTRDVVFVQINDEIEFHLLTLSDAVGNKLIERETSTKVVKLDLTSLAPGTYYLNVLGGTTNETVEIVRL